MSKLVEYNHHGVRMRSLDTLAGTHRDHCLCRKCSKFKPNTNHNCPIAESVYKLDCFLKITTPVFECPKFELIDSKEANDGEKTD